MINKQFTKVFFILFAAVGFASFLPTANALALKDYNSMSSSDQATSHSYYKSIYSCLEKSSIDRDIDQSKANDPPQWINDSLFGVNSEVNTGYLINDGKDTNGTAFCRDIIAKALSFWEVNGTDFLKGIGYTLKADGSQWNAPSSGVLGKYDSYIRSAASTQLTNELEYTLALAALTATQDGCSAVKIGLFKDQDEAVQRMATSKTNGHFTLLSSTGDSATANYIFKRQGNDSTGNNYKPGGSKGSGVSCEQIIARMNQLAPPIAQAVSDSAYITLSNSIYSGLSGVRNKDCSSYPSGIRQECQDGWQSSFNECFAAMKTSLLAAGQNNADGSNSATYIVPGKDRAQTLAACIAKGTGAPLDEVLQAVVQAITGAPTPSANDLVANTQAVGDTKQSCNIEGIGWMVCPVMRFMSQIVDQAYVAIAAMLTTNAVDTSTSDGNPMYKAWSYMRNFANVAFVIAFLIIIFSQLTSVGLNNYGIKKMLPRLIVAAILVNVSYWVCAIAVDISNILGVSLKSLMDTTSKSLYIDGGVVNSGAGGKWDELTVGILGTAGAIAVLYLGISVLFPMLIAALFAIITVVLVLTLRQALIIILIVISPLAFVAYLLPNTEKWFNKWRELFQVLLLMFPIIAVIFGGSALASTIIMNSANGNFILQVMAAGVTIIPLFIVPVVMKTAGGLLNRFGGIVNNPNKGPFDRLKKGATNMRNNSNYMRGKRIRDHAKQGYKDRRFAERLQKGYGNDATAIGRITRAQAGGLGEVGKMAADTKAGQAATGWVADKIPDAIKNNRAVVAATGAVVGSQQAQSQAILRASQGAVAEAARKEVNEAKSVLAEESNFVKATSDLIGPSNKLSSLSGVDVEAHVDFILSTGGEDEVRNLVKDRSLMQNYGKEVWRAIARNDGSVRPKNKDIANYVNTATADDISVTQTYNPEINVQQARFVESTVAGMQAGQLIKASPDFLDQRLATGSMAHTHIDPTQASVAVASDSFGDAKPVTQQRIRSAAGASATP